MPETPRGDWAPDRLRAVAAGIEREFPLTSRRTLLSLFDLDPDQLQAQWQVESGQLALVRGAFPVGLEGIHQRLRLLREDAGQLEVAALSLPAGELDAQGVARFLVSGGPGVLYRAELGLATPEGGWILLARSNLATLPPRPLRVTPPRSAGFAGGQKEAGVEVRPPPSIPPPAEEEASPPWDPTLVDAGLVLEPEFPQPPTLATPSVDESYQPIGAPRSRPTSGRKAPPLVIARHPPPGPGPFPPERQAAPLTRMSAVAPAEGAEDLPASAGQTSPLLATFDPRGARSSPGSTSTSPGSPSGAWADPGMAGRGARFWLFDYPLDGLSSAAGPTPRPTVPCQPDRS
ncbi:MAG: hypothetical protein KAX46_08050 [Chromatiaceae bacterium]|nr:hypothetical protein [Chromatiaceae bacterium]